MKRTRVIAVLASLAVVAVVVGVLVFKPWLLFVDVRVDEALPAVYPTATPGVASSSTPRPSPVAVDLASGALVSHEHETSGTVRVVLQPDGSRVLFIENLDTSNGPDVHVWLSASDVVEGAEGWYVAGGAPYLDLGPLKGNLGSQVYEIPADADLGAYRSVALWCVQFSVSFGAAQLA